MVEMEVVDLSTGEVAPEPDRSLSVVQALNRVMQDVTVVPKGSFNEQQGFKFRGIDDTLNAVGPVFRRHGVLCSPRLVSMDRNVATSKSGGALVTTVVTVEYTFHGPAGDTLVVTVPGEAFDAGDKSTSKAMSVALRIALLQTLTLPTNEPDPDAAVYELGHERPAERSQANTDQGWTVVHLPPQLRKRLGELLDCGDPDVLREAFYEGQRTQQSTPGLVAAPSDLTKDQRELLQVRGAVPWEELLARVSRHYLDTQMSVTEHITELQVADGGYS